VLDELSVAGAEADVVVAEELSSGRQVVLKLYRAGFAPDEEALARLAVASRGPGRDHLVEIIDYGRAQSGWFEVLEHCGHGSLRELMVSGRRPGVVEMAQEVSSALAFAHGPGLRVVHRDLKPENVLVRCPSPFDLVLGDFGVARAVDATLRITRAWGTPAYSPPEAEAGEVSPAWDWWSLGMVIAELAGGRHPFELPDGTMADPRQIRGLLTRPVDLSALADPRALLLCRGLLTRDRIQRWGADQVTDWLAGGSPGVATERSEAPARARQVLFTGSEHSSPANLAAAFCEHWAEALRALFQERDPTLVEETERLLRHHHLDEASRLLAAPLSAAELPRRFADLLAEMDPQLDPVYNDVRLSPAGLEAAALEVVSAGGDHPTARVLDEVRRFDILTLWRALPDMAHGPTTQRAWAGANQELEKAVASLNQHGYQPSTTDWALARAWLLACALNPAHHSAQLASLVESLGTVDAGRQGWWAALRAQGPSPPTLVLTLLTHPSAVQQAHRQDDEARHHEDEQRRAAERESRRARLVEERRLLEERLQGIPRPGDRLVSPGAVALAVIAFLVLGTVLNGLQGSNPSTGLDWFIGIVGAATVMAIAIVVQSVRSERRRTLQAQIEAIEHDLSRL
jgi:hypothetical protein